MWCDVPAWPLFRVRCSSNSEHQPGGDSVDVTPRADDVGMLVARVQVWPDGTVAGADEGGIRVSDRSLHHSDPLAER
jgi:hypothetical protein